MRNSVQARNPAIVKSVTAHIVELAMVNGIVVAIAVGCMTKIMHDIREQIICAVIRMVIHPVIHLFLASVQYR